MYSKIQNDDKWRMCRHSSSGCQTSPSATWQLEWVSEKQKGEEGPCSPNKRRRQMSPFAVFACRRVHRFSSSSSSSSICIGVFVVHRRRRVRWFRVRRHRHRRCMASSPWWCGMVVIIVSCWWWLCHGVGVWSSRRGCGCGAHYWLPRRREWRRGTWFCG